MSRGGPAGGCGGPILVSQDADKQGLQLGYRLPLHKGADASARAADHRPDAGGCSVRRGAATIAYQKKLPYRLSGQLALWRLMELVNLLRQLKCANGGMLCRLLQRRTAEAASSGSRAASTAAAQEIHKRL